MKLYFLGIWMMITGQISLKKYWYIEGQRDSAFQRLDYMVKNYPDDYCRIIQSFHEEVTQDEAMARAMSRAPL